MLNYENTETSKLSIRVVLSWGLQLRMQGVWLLYLNTSISFPKSFPVGNMDLGMQISDLKDTKHDHRLFPLRWNTLTFQLTLNGVREWPMDCLSWSAELANAVTGLHSHSLIKKHGIRKPNKQNGWSILSNFRRMNDPDILRKIKTNLNLLMRNPW